MISSLWMDVMLYGVLAATVDFNTILFPVILAGEVDRPLAGQQKIRLAHRDLRRF